MKKDKKSEMSLTEARSKAKKELRENIEITVDVFQERGLVPTDERFTRQEIMDQGKIEDWKLPRLIKKHLPHKVGAKIFTAYEKEVLLADGLKPANPKADQDFMLFSSAKDIFEHLDISSMTQSEVSRIASFLEIATEFLALRHQGKTTEEAYALTGFSPKKLASVLEKYERKLKDQSK